MNANAKPFVPSSFSQQSTSSITLSNNKDQCQSYSNTNRKNRKKSWAYNLQHNSSQQNRTTTKNQKQQNPRKQRRRRHKQLETNDALLKLDEDVFPKLTTSTLD